MSNKKIIDEINAQIKKAKGNWIAGETSMLQLSPEQQKMMLGYVPGPNELSIEEHIRLSIAALSKKTEVIVSDPPSIDWRNVNGECYVNPIENQGLCMSCVAFGVTSTVESVAQVQYNLPGQLLPLSQEQLFFCGNASANPCETGWYTSAALDYFKNTGIVPASVDIYVPQDAACNFNPAWSNMVTQISDYAVTADINEIKTWLSTKGPVVSSLVVYDDFMAYAGGVYTWSGGGKCWGAHIISMIGYDDTKVGRDGTLGAWLCKNSWGTGWGEEGYFWIGYGECGIDGQVFGINSVPVIYNPQVCLKVASCSSNYQECTLRAEALFAPESDGTWLMADFTGDAKEDDLVFIKTGQSCMEVHVAFGSSNYTTRWDSGSLFLPETDGTWLMADFTGDGKQNDLVFIKVGESCMEVHVAFGSSNYTTRWDSGSLFLPETGGTWLLADFTGDKKQNDLVFIKVGESCMEVHVAFGSANYTTRWDSGSTFFPETDGTWLMADFTGDGKQNDLVFIKSNVETGVAEEVHVDYGSSNYTTRWDSGSCFPPQTDGAWQLADYTGTGMQGDLIFIKFK